MSVTAALVAASVSAPALAQLRVVTWNITNYAGTDRAADIRTAVYGLVPQGPLAGRSMDPDVILLQEILSATALSTFVSVLNSAVGSPGDWAAAPFINGPDSESCMVYRTSKVQLLNTAIVSLGGASPNPPRHTYRYDVRPVGYSAAASSIGMYSSHMKAQESGSDDDLRRLTEAQRIRSNAEGADTAGAGTGLPAGYLFLFGGDTNIQSAGSAEYVAFVGSQANNSGRFFDPIKSGVNGGTSATNGSWNNNANYSTIHTQDPSGSGGMDDRHDQILVCGALIDGAGFEYIGNANVQFSQSTWNDPNHSYRSWGNSGVSCCASPIDTVNNSMVGNVIAQALINCATASGGHLPVYLDLKVPAQVTSEVTLNFGTVQQNAAASLPLSVSNSGDVALWTAAGIANLSYTLSASTGFTAPAGTFGDAAGGTANSHTITMNTGTVGPKSGTITILSDSPDQPVRIVNVTGTVVANNIPPVADAGPDLLVNDLDGSGSEVVTLDGSASTDADGTITNYQWREGFTVLASGAAPTANVALSVGTHNLLLTVTDNSGLLASDTLLVRVNGRPVAAAGADVTLVDVDNSGSETVTLDGTASTDDGTIVSYAWHEGPTLLASTATASVPFAVGAHSVTLTVTDNDGFAHTDTLLVTIDAPSCPADWDDDGDTDSDDIVAFFSAWDQGEGDFDGDLDSDSDDVVGFFTAWDSGC